MQEPDLCSPPISSRFLPAAASRSQRFSTAPRRGPGARKRRAAAQGLFATLPGTFVPRGTFVGGKWKPPGFSWRKQKLWSLFLLFVFFFLRRARPGCWARTGTPLALRVARRRRSSVAQAEP